MAKLGCRICGNAIREGSPAEYFGECDACYSDVEGRETATEVLCRTCDITFPRSGVCPDCGRDEKAILAELDAHRSKSPACGE